MNLEPVAVANYQCVTGENPLWNADEGRIYWEDIETGRLFRASHETLEHECFYRGPRIGGFTFQVDGTLLLFEENRIAVLDPKSGKRRVLIEDIDPDMERFNDVIADPEGRVFAGTIGRTDESGGLYRIDLDGRVSVVWKGVKIANGMGFTGDLRRFYWTDTMGRVIYIADYERSSGKLERRRPFYVAPPSEGLPDGLAVDNDDAIWTTRWDGSSMLYISSGGRVISRIGFPVPKVSSAAFGGPKLDTLYVTTGGGQPGTTQGAEGTLYRVSVPARGRLEFRSRIRL